MPEIPIHNETDYDLLPWIVEHIRAEAIEYFGEALHAIRIQLGIARHVFNTRTREVRYALYPSDYGLSNRTGSSAEAYARDVNGWRFHDDGNDYIPSDGLDDTAEDNPDFAMIADDMDVLDNDDAVELATLDPDFDALDTSDTACILDDKKAWTQHET